MMLSADEAQRYREFRASSKKKSAQIKGKPRGEYRGEAQIQALARAIQRHPRKTFKPQYLDVEFTPHQMKYMLPVLIKRGLIRKAWTGSHFSVYEKTEGSP